ncbi:malic enzyme-like NAD(P)-binding protein [Candidatus Nesciobacter abundans]|nr:malic enzyme-like NAD(P)-binding protein [Candidatus Nesciobacter abundans]
MSKKDFDSKKISSLEDRAREYHSSFPNGKFGMHSTKPLSHVDMSLAYSPGVAVVCSDIKENPKMVMEYTSKQNTVAVISNGTAVLGLGNIGPLASKPVMEGKCVLMNGMAGLYGVDIEVSESNADKIIECVAKIGDSFGAINLEDIKAPECFVVEKELQKRLDIPVFHDDQHGTAIVACAGLENALHLVDKKWSDIKIIVSGAGAAALACLDAMVNLGLKKENVYLFDSKGLVSESRDDLNEYKKAYMQKESVEFKDAFKGTDVFLGLSVAGKLKKDMVADMNKNPIIFGLANPVPEIMPDEAHSVRSDCIVATGRSDLPNQVNNVLCFPYIFRGALDSESKKMNWEMKKACIDGISKIARISDKFGKDFIIPGPLNELLSQKVSQAVAQAAFETGVGKKVDDHGVLIEKRLNPNSEYIFNSKGKSAISLKGNSSETSFIISELFKCWDLNLDIDIESHNTLLPISNSCNAERLLWVFGLNDKPWIALSETGSEKSKVIKDLFKSIFGKDLLIVPVVESSQCRDLERRKDFCGRLSMTINQINMEFNNKSSVRNAAYLGILLTRIADVLSSSN